MLQSMRDNLKGTAAIILAALFGFIVAITGIDFFTGASGGGSEEVASVNGEKISEVDVSRGVRNQQAQMMAQFGENLPAEALSEDTLRRPVIQQLIAQAVMRQAASESGMVMSKEELNKVIASLPAFQVDGQFSQAAFRNAAARQGMSPAAFQQYIEQSLVVQQYLEGIAGSGFVTAQEAKKFVELSMEERDFDYVVMEVAGLLGEISVTDAEIQQYYDENPAEFARPEMVAVKYIELKPETFAGAIDVSEEDIQAQYQQELKAFQASTQRRAAHIFLEGDADAEKVAEVQAKLAAGESFEALVTAYSDDFASKEMGGDLGFTGGDVFPPEFEEALAALSVNEVSGPVETADGTHFVKLTELTESKVPTLEERRAEIAEALKASRAEREFVTALERMTELAYNAEDLAEVAEELGVTVGTTGLFSSSGGEGITAEPKVVAAAFTPEVKEDRNTSDVIDLAEDHALVLQVTEHQPAGVFALAKVAEQISDKLKREKASAQLAEKAEALQAALAAGGDFALLAEEAGLTLETADKSRRTGFGERGEIVTAAFELSGDLPAVKALKVNSGNRVVLKLRDVRPGNLDAQPAEQRNALLRQLSVLDANNESAAMEKYLQDAADISIGN
ncbi:SurA N-terminal domain-containing protein [Biformimicrobium ophioploci]|uniref:Periplasmic chaperone PpiD n=1 Tax=Biformimicrobium ophioploci TaxID=3036711 RepID=A0ABQ6M334_9GAMM|nr:SurA N-terminal domain-containing protein [Microbulbifer sp. NKW57]GMG88685.1 SurA N-terminal domain-containing protein [Microbulbifer sp. NKW57]